MVKVAIGFMGTPASSKNGERGSGGYSELMRLITSAGN